MNTVKKVGCHGSTEPRFPCGLGMNVTPPLHGFLQQADYTNWLYYVLH